ncbi:hypothetical protein PF011_g1669 [Phytophthora fragariae]|uniref:Uncharacterized protein n=1 Tax=Phytophthora fragariae TaxID=53985 RepID=A0A6A3M7N6_9STRA|nr:hypothetical protein PF011_g1669 [Phytophthora fragariae]
MFIVGDGAVVVEVVGDTTSKRPRCTVTILEGETKRVASDESAIKPSTYLKHLAVNVELGEHLTKYLNGNYFEKRRLRADKAHVHTLLCCSAAPPRDSAAPSVDPPHHPAVRRRVTWRRKPNDNEATGITDTHPTQTYCLFLMPGAP